MFWLLMQFVVIVCLWFDAYSETSTNLVIFFATLLIWFTLHELIGVIEKRRKR